MSYKIRFVVLDPHSIYNMCGPDRSGKAQENIDKVNKRQHGFYTKLEQSIFDEGFRNPILVNAGFCQPRKVNFLPQEMQEDSAKILFCHSNGGSRLWFATKHNLIIPCIISDFIDRFKDGVEIKSKEELHSYYKDQPRGINFGEHGITIKVIKPLGDFKQRQQPISNK